MLGALHVTRIFIMEIREGFINAAYNKQRSLSFRNMFKLVSAY
jgi:hypothetical protein